ncbi:hypothetical protein EDC01DRAFT_781990 [Geopyxis carbonaria]|nr:hypothetical protein EDC01DRAFT_781990 [Geopyxis carbonaria]
MPALFATSTSSDTDPDITTTSCAWGPPSEAPVEPEHDYYDTFEWDAEGPPPDAPDATTSPEPPEPPFPRWPTPQHQLQLPHTPSPPPRPLTPPLDLRALHDSAGAAAARRAQEHDCAEVMFACQLGYVTTEQARARIEEIREGYRELLETGRAGNGVWGFGAGRRFMGSWRDWGRWWEERDRWWVVDTIEGTEEEGGGRYEWAGAERGWVVRKGRGRG